MRNLVLKGAVALLIFGTDAEAQSPVVRITPSAGVYVPFGDVGTGGHQDDPAAPEFLLLTEGLAFGLTLEAPVTKVIGSRGILRYVTGSDLVAGHAAPPTSCQTDCSSVHYEHTRLSSGSLILLGADLSLRPFDPTWVATPYLVGGMAFRRYFYDETQIGEGRAARQAEEEAVEWVPHLGLGTEWTVRDVVLRLEAELFGELEIDGLVPKGGRHGAGMLTLGATWAF